MIPISSSSMASSPPSVADVVEMRIKFLSNRRSSMLPVVASNNGVAGAAAGHCFLLSRKDQHSSRRRRNSNHSIVTKTTPPPPPSIVSHHLLASQLWNPLCTRAVAARRFMRRSCCNRVVENGFAWVVAAVPCACALEGYAASDNCSPQDQAARGQFRGGNSSSRNLLLTVPMSQSFPLIQPFMLAELPLILKGWLCTVVAVGALFMFVPEIGELSHLLSQGDIKRLGQKAGKVLLLVAVRSVAQFWQQALLWEAALNITYKLRGFVYQHVLNRDMEYFEGEGGAAAGDIAYRLTAEAEDTGDTVHALLHVRGFLP
jgi:ABC-type multidrug transport system fused ATPase/permease subunit